MSRILAEKSTPFPRDATATAGTGCLRAIGVPPAVNDDTLLAVLDATEARQQAERDARLAYRLNLLTHGYKPVPVSAPRLYRKDDPKTDTAGKAPWIKQWQVLAPIADERQHRKWMDEKADHENTGIVCDGLRAVDIDVDDPAAAARVHELALLHFGTAPERYRDNSCRLLLVYAAAEGKPGKRVLASRSLKNDNGLPSKVEILGTGQQFVCAGLHPSGTPIKWRYGDGDGPGPRDGLVEITEADIDGFFVACAAADVLDADPDAGTAKAAKPDRPPPTRDPVVPLAIIREVVAAIPNPDTTTRDTWLRIGGAIHFETAGSDDGFYVFLDWALRHPEYGAAPEAERAACEKLWESFDHDHDDPCTIGTLMHYARAAMGRGWRPDGWDDAYWRHPKPEAPDEFEATEDAPPEMLAPPAGVGTALTGATTVDAEADDGISIGDLARVADESKKRNFTVQMARDFTVSTAPELVAGWIGAGELVGLIGAPGSFKTTAAADLACSIAHGVEWMGCHAEQGAVLMIELEGAAGFRHRVMGWHADRGLDKAKAPLGMIADGVSLAKSEDVNGLIEAAKAFAALVAPHKLALIVVDTLAMAAAGLDENFAGDMGTLIAALDKLKRKTGATVMVIHHTGLAANDRARGSSAFRGALDAEILVERSKGEDGSTPLPSGVVRALKMREREMPAPMGFMADEVDVGEATDGRIVTAAVTRRGTMPARSVKPLTGQTALAMKCLTEAIEADGEALPEGPKFPPSGCGVREQIWREIFYKSLPDDQTRDVKKKQAAQRQAFNRARTTLVENARICTFDGWIWLPNQPESEFPTEAVII